MPSVVRGLTVPLDSPLPASLLGALKDYRRLVNELVREAITTGKTARGSLSRFARDRAFALELTGQHAVVAAEVALSLAKGHRRRLRLSRPSSVPYLLRPFLQADRSTFHLDPGSGKVRLSLRNGVWCSFHLRIAPYHRAVLASPGVRVKQLHVSPSGVALFVERPAPEPFRPESLIALDTNESSLDGVAIEPKLQQLVTVPFPEVRTVQGRHVGRRRRLARKKATDRRVGRMLLGREGRREHNRVTSRLHVLSRQLVDTARAHRAAIALEDLTRLPLPRRRGRRLRPRGAPRSPGLRRRLSSWPRRELHRQIAYKAEERGVPVYWVNPFRTSVTCPRCGDIQRRSRVGPVFDCPSCHWRMDRQLNAGVNIGQTVLRDYGRVELAGLRLDLDALFEEARKPRYPFEKSDGHGPSGGRGRDSFGPPETPGLG